MTYVYFATCEAIRAKSFLKKFYPTGYHECNELTKVIAHVAADHIRIPDPNLHPGGGVIPGKQATDKEQAAAVEALKHMHAVFVNQEPNNDQ